MVRDLVAVAEGRSLTDQDPWDWGWAEASYHRSGAAAIRHSEDSAIALDAAAVSALERGVERLQKMLPVRERYDPNELWSVVVSLIGTVPLDASGDRLGSAIKSRLERLLDPPSSLVVFPLANVKWEQSPRAFGSIVVGDVSDDWLDELERLHPHGANQLRQTDVWWLKGEIPAVAFAVTSKFQLRRAEEFARELLDDVVGLALMLEPNPENLRLYSGRSDSHRPGPRGLQIDRGHVETRSTQDASWLSSELAAYTFTSGLYSGPVSVSWWGQDPFPLGKLTGGPRRSVIAQILTVPSSIHNRFRTAARWYANGFYSEDVEDAVLSMGIALDAMLGEPGGGPGRTLAERFALLEPDKALRAKRYKRFQSVLYPARSSVAHGSRSSVLDKPLFARAMAADVRWVFRSLWRHVEAGTIDSEDTLRHLFDDLRWGVRSRLSG